MRVLQVLPALNSGGVERGTLELARELVRAGHESLVLSSGGRLVQQLEAEGSRHLCLPVERKSLSAFARIRPVRRLLRQWAPDIVHVRSRLPAWIVWLAWRGMNPARRPRLVSTFHGLYSVNRYSAIMARGERIIAISETVQRYIETHYAPEPERLHRIDRGLDTSAFYPASPESAWQADFYRTFPEARSKKLLLMPGRLSRWKGQMHFLDLMARLVPDQPRLHGLIVGDAEPEKAHYRQQLQERTQSLGLSGRVSFAGHRSDMPELYRQADLVCHLSDKPEPFGRTVTEALACGTPVLAFDRGGAGESLAACYPKGLVPPEDLDLCAARVPELIAEGGQSIRIPDRLTLDHQLEATLGVYRQLLAERR
ncbi:MAG: glycosyltransferase family 4 protein [Oleiphilaceae bacterium]|nr:glycosyltransferase family 4 protein [Oleiphilaceae bacterium]